MQTLVIVPTYNEGPNIGRLVRAILAADPALDVLVVDDNSPDGTGRLADELAQADERVQVLHRAAKQGLGAAYLAGFRYALARPYAAIMQMDADFSHNPDDLPRLLAPLRANEADLVLGSRWVAGGGTRNWPLHRQLISRGGSLYARTVLSTTIRDLTGGFKCWRRETLAACLRDGVRANGYGFQIELTWRALRAGFRVCEVPITFTERVYGHSKMSGAIVREAARLVWQLRFEQQAAPMPVQPLPYAIPRLAPSDLRPVHEAAEPLLEREVGR
jgi:dolichol-phosphate mannosyltransferase